MTLAIKKSGTTLSYYINEDVYNGYLDWTEAYLQSLVEYSIYVHVSSKETKIIIYVNDVVFRVYFLGYKEAYMGLKSTFDFSKALELIVMLKKMGIALQSKVEELENPNWTCKVE